MDDWSLCFLAIIGFCHVTFVTGQFRIYGGYEIDIKEIPYQVALKIANSKGFNTCGGAILDKRYVLTAAHCIAPVYEMDKKNFKITVRSGSNYLFRDGEARLMEGFKIHPAFQNRSIRDSDYAIVKVDSDIEFNDKQKPVGLPSSDEIIKNGHELIVAGWGMSEKGLPDARFRALRAVKLPKFSKRTCRKYYLEGRITDRTMCAGFAFAIDNEKMRIGAGDSGGPLVSTQYGTIQGLSSFGAPRAPSVFARVRNVVPWIKRVMSGRVPLDR